MTFAKEATTEEALIGREALFAMLTYKRPAGSKAERAFIRRFIKPYADHQDAAGNLFVVVGDEPTIAFSSHTDTVHTQGGKQAIEVSQDGWVHPVASNCLGADCTAGVWLMLEMIRADVPGLYIFHREEECGGRGSAYIAKSTPEVLDGIQAVIAFDRKGFSSVITHQWSGRCCSDAFGSSLGNILGGQWALDDTGTFTDSANYVDLVGECTNISVGYLDQHTAKERVNFHFLEMLRDCLIEADWSALEYQRKPGEVEVTPWWERRDYADTGRSYSSSEREDLLTAVLDHPDTVAKLLMDYGFKADDILDMAYST